MTTSEKIQNIDKETLKYIYECDIKMDERITEEMVLQTIKDLALEPNDVIEKRATKWWKPLVLKELSPDQAHELNFCTMMRVREYLGAIMEDFEPQIAAYKKVTQLSSDESYSDKGHNHSSGTEQGNFETLMNRIKDKCEGEFYYSISEHGNVISLNSTFIDGPLTAINLINTMLKKEDDWKIFNQMKFERIIFQGDNITYRLTNEQVYGVFIRGTI